MKKILAIGASNSSKSINTQFATYVANQLEEVQVVTADWKDLVLPLYSPDLEAVDGIPENVQQFIDLVHSVDAVVLSLAEHNGLPSAAFKNLWDWTSRINLKFWSNKPMLLMAASPGGRGGASVLSVVSNLMPHFGGNVVAEFSLPTFHENFQGGQLINDQLKVDLQTSVQQLQQAL